MSMHGKHILYDCPYWDRKKLRRSNLNNHIVKKHQDHNLKMVVDCDMKGGMEGDTNDDKGGSTVVTSSLMSISSHLALRCSWLQLRLPYYASSDG